MHHFVIWMCIHVSLLQNGALWNIFPIHCGICDMGLSRKTTKTYVHGSRLVYSVGFRDLTFYHNTQDYFIWSGTIIWMPHRHSINKPDHMNPRITDNITTTEQRQTIPFEYFIPLMWNTSYHWHSWLTNSITLGQALNECITGNSSWLRCRQINGAWATTGGI